MSTTSKGDKFEIRTKNIITNLLSIGDFTLKVEGQSEFWIVPKNSSVFNKKRYKYVYNSHVIIDVSLENSQDESPYLIIVECKDLSRKVDKGDMGEFCMKVQDLKAKKGVFVTNKGFQKGAIEMAKYHNIALVRIDENDNVAWDLHRIGNSYHISYFDAVEMLCSDNRNFYKSIILDGYSFYNSLPDYFCSLFLCTDSKLANSIPYFSERQIQQEVEQFVNNNKYVRMQTNLMKFCAIRNNILINEETDCMGLMGRFDFYNNHIYIAKDLLQSDEHRYRFTLAHEIGHSVLHRRLLKNFIASAEDKDVLTSNYCSDWEKRLEIQANIFASRLLVPEAPLINYYMEIKNKLGINTTSPLYLDNQPCNKEDCHKMFYVLSKIFNVSKEVIKFRLIDDKLLVVNDNE